MRFPFRFPGFDPGVTASMARDLLAGEATGQSDRAALRASVEPELRKIGLILVGPGSADAAGLGAPLRRDA